MKKKMIYTLVLVMSLTILSCNKGKDAEAPKSSESKIEKKSDPAKKEVALKEIDPKEDLGIGPIKSKITLAALDDAMADKGKTIYKEKCTACHKMKKRYIGPGLKGVTTRRRPEWIMNMILNPVEMVAKNAAAKKLLTEYSAPMADQGVGEEGARAILEYFRRVDSK